MSNAVNTDTAPLYAIRRALVEFQEDVGSVNVRLRECFQYIDDQLNITVNKKIREIEERQRKGSEAEGDSEGVRSDTFVCHTCGGHLKLRVYGNTTHCREANCNGTMVRYDVQNGYNQERSNMDEIRRDKDELEEIQRLVREYSIEKENLITAFGIFSGSSGDTSAAVSSVSLSIEKLEDYLGVHIAQYASRAIAADVTDCTAPQIPYLTDEDREKIRESIRLGVIGEKEVREYGKQVRALYNGFFEKANSELSMISDERRTLGRQCIYAKNAEDRKAITEKFDALRERENSIRKNLTPAEAMKETLGSIRVIGPAENDSGQKYINNSGVSEMTVIAAINNARAFLPKQWIEKSNSHAIHPMQVERGYFIHQDDGTSIIALSSGRGMQRCAFHEIGHHFENLYPEIRKLEHEFYNRRTAGESAKWLGWGYSLNEKTRYDDFIDPYMGKDYGNTEESGYELLSMGIESLYCGSNSLEDDTDYQDFIFGILTAI